MVGVPKNSRIAVDTDRYRRWLPELTRVGTIVRRAGSYCWIQWDDDPENIESLAEADVRYWVDSNKARIQQPTKKTLITEMLKGKNPSQEDKGSPPIS